MTCIACRMLFKASIILEMIKFEHTVFALPFALTSAVVAAKGLPEYRVLGWILIAMVSARSAAMAFNRLVDVHYDRLNPRTANRALPTGMVKSVEVVAFTLVSVAIFVLAALMLNRLAFALSPVALLVVLGYSYTKRFTNFSHLVLGIALGIAPAGAWIGVTGRLDIAPIVLSGAVMFWTAGFDIIYALQDIDNDRKLGLFSIPATLGPGKGLMISRVFHIVSVILMLYFGALASAGAIYYAGCICVGVLLAYEQSLVRGDDFSKVNVAFFNTNGFVSIGYLLFAVTDTFLKGRLV